MVEKAAGLASGRVLLVRADADLAIGTGHVMRCLALSQAWLDRGGTVRFACAACPSGLRERLAGEGIGVAEVGAPIGSEEDRAQTDRIAREAGASWVVVDGYSFDAAYVEALKGGGHRILQLDDCAQLDRYRADLVLNQNIYAHEGMYPGIPARTSLLLGPRYALLRREFRAAEKAPRMKKGRPSRLLVSFGGSDPTGLTLEVVKAFGERRKPGLEATVLIGATNPRAEEIRGVSATLGSALEVTTNASDMARRMADAGVALLNGGSTCYEAAYLGLPAIMVILADNQRAVAHGLDRAGVGILAGDAENVCGEALLDRAVGLLEDPIRCDRMASSGRSLVDGRGASRVSTRLLASLLKLRPARAEDAKTLWSWANDPAVRASAFHQDPIPWEAHLRWFTGKLDNTRTSIYLASDAGGCDIGQIRFEWGEDGIAEVDVSVAEEHRSKGTGAALIRAGCDTLFSEKPVHAVRALIKKDNTPSKVAFECADFRAREEAEVRGQSVWVYALERCHG